MHFRFAIMGVYEICTTNSPLSKEAIISGKDSTDPGEHNMILWIYDAANCGNSGNSNLAIYVIVIYHSAGIETKG